MCDATAAAQSFTAGYIKNKATNKGGFTVHIKTTKEKFQARATNDALPARRLLN
jgi:hypothetical protein